MKSLDELFWCLTRGLKEGETVTITLTLIKIKRRHWWSKSYKIEGEDKEGIIAKVKE